MKNLLEYIVIHLVDNPESVVVSEDKQTDFTQYTIAVHPDDIGRIIGKKGSVISAIRQIARIKAIKDGVMIRVDVDTEGHPKPESSQAEAPVVDTTAQIDTPEEV